MFLRNVRVPKNSLFTKYAEISPEGKFKQVGDARVGYGTMMFIREMISCIGPKSYAQAIIIATRYSFFRKQGLSHEKKELPVLEYQTQQEKVLPRIAEYYALTIGGTKISTVSHQNGENVLKKDFSLLQETHSNLSFSKGLYSEITQDGIETLRRSMGGHGTSYYSGVPQIMNEVTANNTHEGENTVLYVQTARYILKSYLGHLQGKPLTDSVKYIARLQDLSDVSFTGNSSWTLNELKDMLAKAINHLISQIATQLTNRKQG
jgi:hypothetical protein